MLKTKEFMIKRENSFVIDKKEIDINSIAFIAKNGIILHKDEYSITELADVFLVNCKDLLSWEILTIAYNV